MRASTEAGLAFSISSVTLVHGMSRPLGRFQIGHGMANAQLLPTVTHFSEAGDRRYKEVQSILFPDSDPSHDKLSELLRTFVHKDLRIPTLSTFLADSNQVESYKTSIGEMTEEAIQSGSPANNLRQ